MTPADFIAKWRSNELKERSASQSHFNDLCALLGVVDPTTADSKGEWFAFEKGASKTSGGNGWADVWRKGCFAWEYKGRHANLDKALAQLLQYQAALENPPLLIVSDMDRIVVRTNFTNTVQDIHAFDLEDLRDGDTRERLKRAFTDPDSFKPSQTRTALTEETAREFAGLAQRLRDRGHDAGHVAHFVNQLVFCMFAEDSGLLPDNMFTKMIQLCRFEWDNFPDHAGTLFRAMADKGGKVGFTRVEWFNGGLFDGSEALPLNEADVEELAKAAQRDWSQIDPSILGTLFERGLDPAKRSQLGAHYTDRDKIMMIVKPVIIDPLEAEWAGALGSMTALIDSAPKRTTEKLLSPAEKRRAEKLSDEAAKIHGAFIDRLVNFRVLDPACGSGNFLYVALRSLKDLEHRANLDAEALGLPRGFPRVGPECVLGIELNPYAAELARVSVWIGEIQWMRRNGFDAAKNPILRTLDTIECRDAVLNADGTEAAWPIADAIIGNPPFLGAKIMKRGLGVFETEAIRRCFDGRLPGFTDLVCYWFEKARAQIVNGNSRRAGLVATNSIAKNTNLPVLYRIAESAIIFSAWSDEAWVVDGASVRVALVCFQSPDARTEKPCLNGQSVEGINPDLTVGLNVSALPKLAQNKHNSFVGIQKSGPFDISSELARRWLQQPLNPNRLPNSDVLRPTRNGRDVTTSRNDTWLIDFPRGLSETEAALWESPFSYLESAPYDPDDSTLGTLAQVRSTARDMHPRREWWTAYWPRPDVRAKLNNLHRYIVTPMTSEHRLFLWMGLPSLPDNNLIIIARDDDTHFGILHSAIHEAWATRIGNRMGAGNQRRYNGETIYETFPFPSGLTPNIPAADYADDPRAIAIATAAARLNELRENWLNPADLVVREPEVVAGYPDRILPRDEDAAKELKKRTLTNLYNARPAWLDNAHRALDEAVADAYGWGDDWRAGLLTEDEILARLFRLNQERATVEQAKR